MVDEYWHPHAKLYGRECIEFWFDVLNDKVFYNTLKPFDVIEIRNDIDYYGCIDYLEDVDGYKLTMLDGMDLDFIVGTLAHEMVHLYQWTVADVDAIEPEEGCPFFEVFQKRCDPLNIYILNEK